MNTAQLRSYLECPVCILLPHSTKILACKNTHQICQKCFDKIQSDPKKCPQCRCNYASPPTRYRVIEDLIRQAVLDLNCQNAVHGCPVELKRDELSEHENECQFRLVPCPEADCQEMVVLSQLEAHYSVTEDHDFELNFLNLNVSLTSEDITGADDKFLENSYWTMDGFRFCRILMKLGNIWYTWVCIVAGPKVAAQWKFSARVENKNTGMFVEAAWPVAPIDWAVERVLSSGHCLTLTTGAVQGLKEEDESDEEERWLLSPVFVVKQI